MPSQLPEHVVVALLRQCFITPRCQASRIRQRTLLRSSRALSSIRSSPSLRHRQALCPETQQKRSFIPKSEADKVQPSGGVESHTPAEINDYQPQLLLAEQHEAGRGQGQPQTGTRIAVLGGGITGLSTAYYLTKELPNAKITIYEGSERVGGWLSSKYVDVGNGKILFEQGPRTLRPHGPAALVTLEMVSSIGLFPLTTVLNAFYRSETSESTTRFSLLQKPLMRH
jgi:oxygen-dependent protoporphyrinogen oxidase